MKLSWAAAAACAALSGPALADRLTAEGAPLPPAAFTPGEPFAVSVEIGDETVLSAHATLRSASSNVTLARDRDGFWAPWDGDIATLPPTAALREDGRLTFKLFAAPPAGLLTPYTVTIAYRTPAGLRFGWLQAEAAR